MMKKRIQHFYLCFVLLLVQLYHVQAFAYHPDAPDSKTVCNEICGGAPYYRQELNTEQFEMLLEQHRLWLLDAKKADTSGKPADINDNRRANLCGVKLKEIYYANADLSRADLRCADLRGAKLLKAKLHRTSLDYADLSNADLSWSDFSNAYLFHAKLHSADLGEANLNKANLDDAALTGANLRFADLSHARLQRTDLSHADLYYADLTGSLLHHAHLEKTVFFPKSGSLPDIIGFKLTNFELMDYYESGIGAPSLTELRAAYKSAGMRQMERRLTYMLEKADQEEKLKKGISTWDGLGALFSKVLFEWTCDYGLAPQRPLYVILLSIFGFGFIYWLGIRTGKAQVYVLWTSRNFDDKWEYHKKIAMPAECEVHKQPINGGTETETAGRHCQNRLRQEWRLFRAGMHLSILSAFDIGWRHYDVGMWINRLQSREYSLETPRGWIKSLCGLQSLISVYMLALWAITQFGNPFL
ncbi:MAG: pentapeptide repeat-containing protein [Gammaproteobacteria bacterium]|nr:pentapeptide repeat-containing protein [Gammaproteobacteria bacterium]